MSGDITTTGRPRAPNNFYATPRAPVAELVPHLPPTAIYAEPCAGNGALVLHLAALWPGGFCIDAFDIAPQPSDIGIRQADALNAAAEIPEITTLIITNPPYSTPGGLPGDPMAAVALALSDRAPTWLLLPAQAVLSDYWRSRGLAARCTDIVPVRRITWYPKTRSTDTKSHVWARLAAGHTSPTILHPLASKTHEQDTPT